MLKIDPALNHIPAQREHVIGLFESINQPLVNIPGSGAAPTSAFVLGTRNDKGHYNVFVYLHQPETRQVVIYVSDPRNLRSTDYRAEQAEAVRFVESMGFMVDDLHFPTLPPEQQDIVMSRVPIFSPPEETIDLFVVAGSKVEPSPPSRPSARPQQSPEPAHRSVFGGLGQEEVGLFGGLSGAHEIPRSPSRSPSRPAAPRPAAPRSAEPGRIVGGRPMAVLSGQGSQITPHSEAASGGYVSQVPAPVQAEEDPAVTEARRARLGRLLRAFGLLLAMSLPASLACRSGPSPAVQAEAQSFVDLGNQNLAETRWAEAVKAFEQAVEVSPENRDALRGLGFAYAQLRRPTDAEAYYERALKADPKWSLTKNELATLKIARGACAEAKTLLASIQDDIFYETPQFAEHNLALAEHCLGEKQQAVKRLERLLKKFPYFCLGYLTLSQYAVEQSLHDTTIGACQGFIQKCAYNEAIKTQISAAQRAAVYRQMAEAYTKIGDVESARSAYMRCANEGESGRDCQAALQRFAP